ncbi:hypothetical protein [Bacillus sp. EB600]|uniref:hypothetical protein n=1 Tax=Bacillus sp. EB600 TaxID=2806345 RepID=UPI00210EE8B0|nr:hypothetical protein [Bacillus sp. EB600]MCQ6282720.1 hypothetical protein [Bacillus sp. EB600]
MLENVSIIIPFQTDHGPRKKAFEWVKKYNARVMPETELCVGIMDSEEINKSKAWCEKIVSYTTKLAD